MSEGKNPFPGLRPFEYHEYELFFGREEQYDEMVAKLSETRFLAVVGTSGSGKSSLVKAGLLPALYGGQMFEAGPHWRVAEFRPKDDPIRGLALALNHKRVFGDSCRDEDCSDFKLTESTNWFGLCSRVEKEANGKERNPSGRILELVPPDKRSLLSGISHNGDGKDRSKIVQIFNGILRRRDFYQVPDFQGVPLSEDVRDLLARDRKSLTDEEIGKLNRLLLEESFPQEIAKKIESQAQITEVTLRRGDLGLIEIVREAKMAPEENLLVVVDQFEELFRYAKISEHGPHGNQAAAFVKLLLAASAQTEIPIYVVLTMRSDYLGDCAKFWGLPEAINKGQYLIPRLTRDQRREAIKGPIELRGVKITAQLVNQLLNDMGDDPDQLPILQHALMRTWDQWEKDNQPNEPIDIYHYDAIGRMADALSIHADEAYNELPEGRSREIAEKMFKCLTEKGTGHSETRRPTSVNEILAVTGATFRELVNVIHVFRMEGRSFLLPAARKPLKRETLIDISHESLIRNWKRLKQWVKDESESANVYTRLVQTAGLYQQHQVGTLTDLEIEYASRWKSKNNPNLAWASRYHIDLPHDHEKDAKISEQRVVIADQKIFDGAMGFLALSRTNACIRKLTKILVAAAIVVLVIAAVMFRVHYALKANRLKAGLTYNAEINLAQRELEAGNFAAVNRLFRDSEDVNEQLNILDPFTWKFAFAETPKSTLRNFEWHYLWRLSHDEVTTLAQYDSPIISVSYLAEFKTVALATRNGQIMWWDMGQGRRLADTQGAPIDCTTVTFAPDRKSITIGRQDGSIGIWELSADLQRVTLFRTLRDQQRAPVNGIAYSPDNKRLAFATQDGQVSVLSLTDNREVQEIRLKAGGPISLVFSHDNQLLAIGQDQGVTVRDVNTSTEWKIDLNTTLPEVAKGGLAAPITSLSFSPDRSTLAIGTKDNSVILWDVAEQKYLISLADAPSIGPSWEISAVAFSDQITGVLASASTDGSIKIWDTTGFLNPKLRKALNSQNTPAGSPKAIETSRKLLRSPLKGHAGLVTAMAFLPNQTIVTASEDRTVKSWLITTGQNPDKRLELSSSPISSLAFSPNGKSLAYGKADGSLAIWSADDKQSQGNLLLPQSAGRSMGMPIAFSHDQILAAATNDNSIKLWRMNNLREAPKVLSGGRSGTVLALAFSPDGKWLATGGTDQTVTLWDVHSGESFPIADALGGVVLSVAFSPGPGSMLAIGTSRHQVILWDLVLKKQVGALNGHSDVISSIAFSPDGELIATGSWDRTAKLWDAESGKELLTLQGHFKKVLSLAFFPTGNRLVTSSEDGTVRLWDTSYEEGVGGKNIRNALLALQDPGLMARSAVTISPDGLTLATGNADGSILLRYGATEQEIAKQNGPPL